MNFGIERPYAFYALLLLIPALIYVNVKFKKITVEFYKNEFYADSKKNIKAFKLRFFFRTLCRAIAWIMLVAAYAGISWGTASVPVQKSGKEAAFVFDISYSMEASDGPGGMTRLEAASNYADELLHFMEFTSVSVVLAKGDAAVVVPSTEDFNAVRAILSSLSPELITTGGSSLGSGVMAALSSFPKETSRASCIWVFTDGEETDSSLAAALTEAVNLGIPTAIVGFGSEFETSVTAGDGLTQVQTALRSEQIKKTISSIQRHTLKQKWNSKLPVLTFIDASEPGSAYKLLQYVKPSLVQERPYHGYGKADDSAMELSVVYEIKSVSHNSFFIILAIVFFALSFVFGEFRILPEFSKRSAKLAGSAILTVLLFSSCNGRIFNGKKILEGRMEWNRSNYQDSIGDFLEVVDKADFYSDAKVKQYALFGLASTYMMQDENEAALKRFEQIDKDAPQNIRFSVLYNSGIIAHRQGDYSKAAALFKQALEIDSSNVNAKINLELSLKEEAVKAKAYESTLTPATVDTNKEVSPLESAVYSVLREKETKQWKSMQSESTEKSPLDY